MSGLRGNPSTMRDLAKRIKELPIVVAQKIAQEAARAVTAKAQANYDSRRSVYGAGRSVSLVRTGTTKSLVRFVSIGTLVRASLGTRYAKYLIGKYQILPMGAMPYEWQELIGKIGREIMQATIAKGAA